MKRTVLNLVMVVCALIFFNFESTKDLTTNSLVAKISFESQTIDYGEIVQHSDGSRQFTFENTGDTPLVITHVKTTCGCTVPSYSKEPILPGKTGIINIKYDTRRVGAFSKSIRVLSNTASEITILKIKGTVILPQG
jgi:hypothetical protein